MNTDPVCSVSRHLGHTFWPWDIARWWLSLTSSDQGAWVAGVGAFLAALAAVLVSDTERRRRNRQRNELARIAASYMYTDIQKIVIHAVHMRRWLDELADIPNGQPYVDPMQRIAVAVKTIKPIFDRMALERIAMLPPKVGVELAQSVGGFPFLCDAIDSTIYELGILTRPLDERRVDLRDHALILSNPLNGIVCFLEWFGSEFPDDRESGPDEAIKLIKAGSANRTTQ